MQKNIFFCFNGMAGSRQYQSTDHVQNALRTTCRHVHTDHVQTAPEYGPRAKRITDHSRQDTYIRTVQTVPEYGPRGKRKYGPRADTFVQTRTYETELTKSPLTKNHKSDSAV